MMSSANDTGFTPSTLFLMGLPGLEAFHTWLSAPLLAIYIVTLLGNCSLLLAIKTVPSLHKPMYLLLFQLAFCDLGMSSCIAPKMLGIFWFNDGEISFTACLFQMFFMKSFLVLASCILTAMAFDRYVAVCNPLRYYSIITNSLIAKIAVVSLARAVILIAPLPLLTLKLPFCSRYIAHSFCENLAVAKLSCADITANSVYVLVIFLLIVPVDILCIAFSYSLILTTVLRLSNKKASFKAFSTCGSHICVISALYGPVLISIVMQRFHHSLPPYVQVSVSNTYLLFSPLMNPLIYGVTMKEVRQGMLQIFQKNAF